MKSNRPKLADLSRKFDIQQFTVFYVHCSQGSFLLVSMCYTSIYSTGFSYIVNWQWKSWYLHRRIRLSTFTTKDYFHIALLNYIFIFFPDLLICGWARCAPVRVFFFFFFFFFFFRVRPGVIFSSFSIQFPCQCRAHRGLVCGFPVVSQ